MKAILVKDCINCPLSEIYKRGEVYCDSTGIITKRGFFDSVTGNIATTAPIPNWCPLTDAEEVFQEFASSKTKQSNEGNE